MVNFEKACQFFESEEVGCELDYVLRESDMDASSIGGVSRAHQISPSIVTVQWQYQLLELRADESSANHTVKVGEPIKVRWTGLNGGKVRVPLSGVLLEAHRQHPSCAGEYFSCRWGLVWTFHFGRTSSTAFTSVWL